MTQTCVARRMFASTRQIGGGKIRFRDDYLSPKLDLKRLFFSKDLLRKRELHH
jgi:hypothetical protein